MSPISGVTDQDDPLRRLLLVEDEPADAALVRELLASVGLTQVHHVATAQDAVETLTLGPVDCVLLDLGLPDAEGFEALAALLSLMTAPPVVVLTGADEDLLGNTALQMGAEDFLSKDLLSSNAASALLDRSLRYAVTRHRQRTMLTRESAELRWLAARQRQFIDGVADGLMGPVTALYGLAATLAERDRKLTRNERRMLLDKIAANAQQISGRLSEFMEDARPGSTLRGPRRQLSLADVVPAAINAVAQRPEGTTITVAGELPMVWGHREALQRALTALVDNALTHAPGGAVPHVEIVVERYGRGIRIIVADDGQPIPLPRRPSMFEPGVKLRESSPGDGLGLSLVRAVVSEHGGAVWIEESGLGGTAVIMTIPQREFERERSTGSVDEHARPERR